MAQGWLVYQLTGSKLALGTISFIGPSRRSFLMLPAGAVADRVSRRKLMLVTQTVMMIFAFILAVLHRDRALQVWHIAVLAFILGIASSFDAPARHGADGRDGRRPARPAERHRAELDDVQPGAHRGPGHRRRRSWRPWAPPGVSRSTASASWPC